MEILHQSVENLNSRPYNRKTNLAPKDFTSTIQDPLIDKIKPKPKEDDWRKWVANQKAFDSKAKKKIRVGSLVYLRAPKSALEKSSDIKATMIYSVYRIDSYTPCQKTPV